MPAELTTPEPINMLDAATAAMGAATAMSAGFESASAEARTARERRVTATGRAQGRAVRRAHMAACVGVLAASAIADSTAHYARPAEAVVWC